MFRRIRNLFQPNQLEADIREELEFHRTQTSGSFGNFTSIQEQARAASTVVWLETLVQDLRYGLRQLRKAPVLSAVAVLSLALGIGANTAIFSLMNAVLLRSLPVTNPEELALIVKRSGSNRGNFSYPFSQLLKGQSTSFSRILVTSQPGRSKIEISGVEQPVTVEDVSADYFDVLGVKPVAGRFFVNGEDHPGAPAFAVISYGFWKRQFANEPGVVGKTIERNGEAFTIIGIAPPEFFGISVGTPVDVWTPLSRVSKSFLNSPGMNFLQIVGRLRPGVSMSQAQAETDMMLRQHLLAYTSQGAGWTSKEKELVLSGRIVIEPGATGLAGLRLEFSKPLRLLIVITAMVLLICCANIANLLLARGAARRKEITMRLAIGAGRRRIVRQLVTESLLLASLGGALAVWFAYGGAQWVVALISSGRGSRPLVMDVSPDWRILLFSAVVTLMVGLLFGIAPAMRATRGLVVNERSAIGESRRFGFGKLLIAFQVALTIVLVIGSGLFLRTLGNLRTLNVGYQADHLYTLDFGFRKGFADASKESLHTELPARLAALPGVVSASLGWPSYSGGGWTNNVTIPSYSTTETPEVYRYRIAPAFFETMRIPLVHGRDFTLQDTADSPGVTIINQSLAKRYFAGRDPIGQYIRFPGVGKPTQVIGIAGDSRAQGLRQEPPAIAYTPLTQSRAGSFAPVLVLRLSGKPPDWGRELKAIHPALQFERGAFVTDRINNELLQERMLALLSSFFGGLALLLASIGLYGVLSYSLARRTTEIGVRLALGARPREVVRMVLGESLGMLGLGLTIGIVIAFALTRLVREFLFGIEPNDPVTVVLAVGTLIVVGLTASFLPARRAARLDPMNALRSE